MSGHLESRPPLRASLMKSAVYSTFRVAAKRLLVLDYDGTLTPIVNDPAQALPSEKLIVILQRYLREPRNTIWIISGRTAHFLQEHLGFLPGLGLCAEHGAFLRYPHSLMWRDITQHLDMSWQNRVVEIYQEAQDRLPGSEIERKRVALTFHYRNCSLDPSLAIIFELKAKLEGFFKAYGGLEIIHGKNIVEVRPRIVTKGAIVNGLVYRLDPARGGPEMTIAAEVTEGIAVPVAPPGFILCVGDDATDEDMFKELESSWLDQNSVYTCFVGPDNVPSKARWNLEQPCDVLQFLAIMEGMC